MSNVNLPFFWSLFVLLFFLPSCVDFARHFGERSFVAALHLRDCLGL